MNIGELIGFFILNGFEVENVNPTLDIVSDRKSLYFNNVKNNVSFWLYKLIIYISMNKKCSREV